MKQIEHDAFMEEIAKKKTHMIFFIALLVFAFVGYYFLVRPLLRAYI